MRELQARWNIFNLEEYINTLKLKRKSENGVFGFKAHYFQFRKNIGDIDIESTFPNAKYIYITRKKFYTPMLLGSANQLIS